MVTLEVGLDVHGVVAGGATAAGALGSIAGAAATMNTALQGSAAATSAFGVALSSAMPWVTAIGGLLSGLAAGMGLMAAMTREATSEWTKLGDAVEKAQAGIVASGILKLSPMSELTSQRDQQRDALRAVIRTGEGLSMTDLRRIVGKAISREELLQMGAAHTYGTEAGNQIAQFATEGRFLERYERFGPQGGQRAIYGHRESDLMFPNIAVRKILERSHGYYADQVNALDRREQAAARAAAEARDRGIDQRFAVSPQGLGLMGARVGEFVRQSPEERGIMERRIAMQEMKEMEATAQRIGDYLGDAAIDFAAGLRDGRDILGSILLDIGRGLSREAMGQATKAIISTIGKTVTQ